MKLKLTRKQKYKNKKKNCKGIQRLKKVCICQRENNQENMRIGLRRETKEISNLRKKKK